MIKIFFENPFYLWYLLSVPVLIISHFVFIKNAHYKALRFANFDTIRRITGKGKNKVVTRNWSLLFFRVLILLSVILSISGPILWYKTLTYKQDFVIAIDSSVSMLAKDFSPNRLGAAKVEAKNFIQSLNGNANIGLVDFAGSTFVDQALTSDKKKVLEQIDFIDIVPVGGTDISGAIITATNLLINSKNSRTIILISDGSDTVDAYNSKSLSVALNYANDNQVIVHTIGVGSNNASVGYLPEYYNVTALYDSSQLRFIANQTGGIFFDAKNSSQFRTAFNSIIEASKEGYVSKDLRQLFLLISLFFLFIEWGLSNTSFRRLP